MYEINLANRLSHAWVHFRTALASLFTDHKMSGLPIRAKYKHFSTICEQTWDNSPTDSSSSCLSWWSSKQRLETLNSCSVFFCLLIHSIARRIFEHVLPCRGTTPLFLRETFPTLAIFSVAPAEIRDSNIFENSSMFSFGLHSRWVHPKYKGSGHEVGSPRSTSFINSFHMGLKFCFRPVILTSSTCAEKNNPCFLCANRHSRFGILPIRVPTELPRSVFPIPILPMGDHTHFVEDEPQDLQCLPRTSATCVVEERIHTSGHYPSQSGNLAMTSIHYFCGSHLGRRRTLSRKNCVGSTAVFHSPRSTTRLMSINVTKWPSFCLFCATRRTSFLLLIFPAAMPVSSPFFPLLEHCCPCIRNLHCLKHCKKFVNQIVLGHRRETFHSLPRGFMRFLCTATHRWDLEAPLVTSSKTGTALIAVAFHSECKR